MRFTVPHFIKDEYVANVPIAFTRLKDRVHCMICGNVEFALDPTPHVHDEHRCTKCGSDELEPIFIITTIGV